MKILLSTDTQNKIFNSITEHLGRLGYNLLEDRKKFSEKNAKKDLATLESNIKNADIVIIDITEHDFKTGYIISKALADKKIVIALESENSGKKTEPLLYSNKSKNLLIREFGKSDIESVVDSAINDAKKRLDTKFILIISPEIDRYLDWASQSKRMHKAQIVRSSVESVMKKDKEYKDYLGTAK